MKKTMYCVVAGLFLCASLAQASVLTAQSGYWSDGSTWTGGVKPASTGVQAVIRGGHVVTVNTSESLSISGEAFNIGDWGGTGGTLNILSVGSLYVNGESFLGHGGTGILNIAGVFSVTNSLRLGRYGSATATITGGQTYCGALFVATEGSGTAHLQVDGGTFTIGGGLLMGANGSVDITGGRFILTGNVTDVTSYGNVTAYDGLGTFVYDYDSDAGVTVVTAAIPEPATLLVLGMGLLFARKK